jgi:CubicO group peptidase (beta-lactamase class C family)
LTLISRNGKVVHFEAQGDRYTEERLPMTKDTIFFIASMTKPITSVALMTLYEEGKFLLDDPISRWIPEYSDMVVALQTGNHNEDAPNNTVPAKRPITVRHLLTNTAGLSTAYKGLTALGLSTKPDTPKSVEEAIMRLASHPLESHPGDAWGYRNSAGIAGVIVEKISGMTLDEFFKVRIFDPLSMSDTHFNVPESKVERVAAIYRIGSEGTLQLIAPPKYHKPHKYFSGSGGLSSTAMDYWRFLQMILNGGELDGERILGPKTVDLMITNHIGDLYVDVKGPGYGFGLGYSILLDPGKAKEPLSPGSFGWGGTFNTYFWVDPAEAMIAIMMTQVRPSPLLDVQSKLSVLATQAIIERGADKGSTIRGYKPIR